MLASGRYSDRARRQDAKSRSGNEGYMPGEANPCDDGVVDVFVRQKDRAACPVSGYTTSARKA